jgi:hypothetical protein
LFFNFAALFDFGCRSLAQMSFVDCYLPYFRQQFITCPLLALLPFQPLFTESSREDQLLSFPPFSGVLTAPHPLCCVFLFSSLFIYLFIYFRGGRSVCPWGYTGLSAGGCGNTA